MKGRRPVDFSGQKFGRLVVKSQAANRGAKVAWLCQCECGRETTVTATHLKSGHTISCGCRLDEVRRENKHAQRHGMSFSPIYSAWRAMIYRCERASAHNYADYGGRGITVCERWHTFLNFVADMGERPEGTSLDRIDNDKGYEPGNCRWATDIEQIRNRRTTIFVEFKGERMPLGELAEKCGISAAHLRARLRVGWTVERAASTPLDRFSRPRFRGSATDP